MLNLSFMNYSHVHFIGIGGIGVSAIAKLLHTQGVRVTGSDASESAQTEELRSLGILVNCPHSADHISKDTDLIIFSEAVPEENPEREAGRKLDIRALAAAAFLGEYTSDKKLIAVSGTNGKSTTTAMLGLILEKAGMDPTVILGSKLAAFPLGNVRVGKSDIVVLEADEYRAKFLHYHPSMVVLTNIEEDHLDFFEGLEDIVKTFDAYLSQIKKDGVVVLNADDETSMHELRVEGKRVTYGMREEANYIATHLHVGQGMQRYEIVHDGKTCGEYVLHVPGRFNVSNALAAASAAHELGVSEEVIQEALAAFPGIWRRFEVVGKFQDAMIVSDYGHHPTAMRVTLQAAREFYPHQRIVLVFQPHQHNRTKRLFDDFVASLSLADYAIVSDIYHVAGREESADITSEDLVRAVDLPDRVVYGGTLDETKEMVKKIVQKNDVVIVMGAGDVDRVAREIVG